MNSGRDILDKMMRVPAAFEAETGYRPNPASCWRWAVKGTQSGARLRTWKVGGSRMTTRRSVRQFIEEKTRQDTPTGHCNRAQAELDRELGMA